MACIGIDIGQQNAVVAIARRGGIDVLSNEVSKPLTASMVGFLGKERKLGEQALSGITSNLTNTITGVKAVIGKKYHSEDVQKELNLVGYKMIEVGSGNVGIPVSYNEEEVVLTPERAMSMVLKCMQFIAELDQKGPVTDVVLSVPHYFTDAERHAMLDAAKVSGLNCLRLMNDITAAALAYGIYKTDMPVDKPTHVAFVDCGAMDTTVAIISFVKGKLTVLSVACDRHLGGRDFDMILAEHFAAEWKEKHKIDAKSSKKAMYRLVTAAEKTKKILSANPQAPINIENFMNDIDVKGMMDRSEMLAVAEPLLVKLDGIMEQAFKASGLMKEDISSVEIIGGTSRIPAVKDRIAKWFGLERCSTTLNADEAIAKGCALQCAMLSPAFKVRDFSVNDVTMYPIALSWSSTGAVDKMEVDQDEGECEEKVPTTGSSSVVFSKFNSVPNTKMLTFYRKEAFSLSASYDSTATLPMGFPMKLADFTVTDIPNRAANADGTIDPAKIKIKLRLDIHGVLTLESAVAIEEQEVVEEVKAEPPPPAPDAAPPAEGEAAVPPAEAPAEPEKKKSRKVKRIALTVQSRTGGLTSKELMEAQEAEANMQLLDKMIKGNAEAMNALEATVYKYRSDISERLGPFFPESDKEKFGEALTTMEDWLYDNADQEKAVYDAKRKEMLDMFAPGEERYLEAETRPDAFAELEKAIAAFAGFASSTDEQYAHISAEEKQKVEAEVAQAQAFHSEAKAKLDALPATEMPPVKAADISAKAAALTKACKPIMSKPKPLPPKPEPAADAPPAEPATPSEGAGDSPPDEGADAADAPKKDDMEVE